MSESEKFTSTKLFNELVNHPFYRDREGKKDYIFGLNRSNFRLGNTKPMKAFLKRLDELKKELDKPKKTLMADGVAKDYKLKKEFKTTIQDYVHNRFPLIKKFSLECGIDFFQEFFSFGSNSVFAEAYKKLEKLDNPTEEDFYALYNEVYIERINKKDKKSGG